MATRFYLPSTGSAPISPDFVADWYDTSLASKLKAVTTKISSAFTEKVITDSNNTDRHFCVGMWVSDPITAQTISAQIVGLVIRSYETVAASNMYVHWTVRVIASDGVTVRGTIVAFSNHTTEIGTAYCRRYVGPTSTEVVAQDNDYIVIEVGLGGDPTSSNNHNSRAEIGDNSSTDLTASDATETNQYCPWVNFANTLTFGWKTTLNAGASTASGKALTVTNTGAPQTVNLANGASVTAGLKLTLTTEVTLTLSKGSSTTAGQALTLTATATIALVTGTSTTSGKTLTAASEVTVSLVTGASTATGQALGVQTAGPQTVDLATGTSTTSGKALTVASEATVSLLTGSSTATGRIATVTSAVTVSPSTGSSVTSGKALTVTSEVTVTLAVGASTASGKAITLSAAVTISLSTGSCSTTGRQLSVSNLGAGEVQLYQGSSVVAGQVLAVTPGAVTIGFAAQPCATSGKPLSVENVSIQLVPLATGTSSVSGRVLTLASEVTVSLATGSSIVTGRTGSISNNFDLMIPLAAGSAIAAGLTLDYVGLVAIIIHLATGSSVAVGLNGAVTWDYYYPPAPASAIALGDDYGVAPSYTPPTTPETVSAVDYGDDYS